MPSNTSLQPAKLLTLVDYKDPILRKTAKLVEFPLTKEDQEIIQNMKYSIDPVNLKKTAVGMAANQWGIDRRIFIFNPTGDIKDLEVIINPSYSPVNDITTGKPNTELQWEGCFSIPLAVGNIKRYTHIKVKYQDETGKFIEKELIDWPARVWQHENDHLNGTLYDDPKAGKCIEKKQFASKQELEDFYNNEKNKRNNKIKEKKLTSNCHCGSKKQYKNCCGLYLVNHEIPSTPEQLMRSRYSAYVDKNLDYIMKTMQDPALSKFINAKRAEFFNKNNIEWLNLTVIKSYYDPNDNNIGFVEFIAKYKLDNVEHAIHELSKFCRKNGYWYYIDGKHL